MVKDYQEIAIRPPSEAYSFLLQATVGCNHNRCTFCGTYKNVRFSVRPFDILEKEIAQAAKWYPQTRRAFLCDGDAMCLPTGEIARILDSLKAQFPNLERTGIYANAQDILSKSDEELRQLREKKLSIAYMGLESGNDEILKRVHKGATAAEMIEAVQRAQAADIAVSVIVLLGLGSKQMSKTHAVDSAHVVNAMNPRFLSALTIMLLPGTRLYRDHEAGKFQLLDPLEILQELRWMLEEVDLEGPTIFRTNHASNYLPLGGVLPGAKQKMLEMIDKGLSNPAILRPETRRAL